MEKGMITVTEWHKRFTQQARWTNGLRNYLKEKIALQPNSRILEVGCGTCAVLSQFYDTNMQSYGVDIDLEYIKFGRNYFDALHLVNGNGMSLPYPANTFDLVFCHYLLLWVENPIRIMQEFTRVSKPGAYVVILAEPDYGGRIDYPRPLQALGEAQTKSLLLQGANPLIGRKIREIAISSGLKILEHGVLNNQSDIEIDQEFIDSEWQMLEHDLSNQLTDEEIQHFKQIDLEAWMQGIRVLFIPIFYLLAEI